MAVRQLNPSGRSSHRNRMSPRPWCTRRGSLRALTPALAVALAVLMVGCADSGRADSGANSWSDGPGSDSGTRGGHTPKTSERFSAGPSAVPERHLGPQGSFGQFVTDCALSHSSTADPIVRPAAMSGAEHADHGSASSVPSGASGTEPQTHASGAHLHNFFGNTSTDSASTLKYLLEAGTTCQKKLDRAAYWSPALYDHGEIVKPTKSTAYYRVAPRVDPKSVQAFPPGLKIIAGDASATSAQSSDLVGWGCGVSTMQSATPPECPVSAPLRSVITFPDCWDGLNIDSPDHRSHMTNSVKGLCPASHPVHVPQLTFAIVYPIHGPGHALSLASGPVETLHSDLINSWRQDSLEREVNQCLRRNVTCSVSSNRGEEYLFEG